jgi:hypothetical protein
MLKWPLDFLRQPISIFKKTMEQMTAVATNVTVEKRPEETLIDGVRSEESSNKKQKTEVGEARSIKRKYALLIGYCGEGYYGLQRNAKQKSEIIYRAIEDEIVEGLVKINAIPQEHADEMFKVLFLIETLIEMLLMNADENWLDVISTGCQN